MSNVDRDTEIAYEHVQVLLRERCNQLTLELVESRYSSAKRGELDRFALRASECLAVLKECVEKYEP